MNSGNYVLILHTHLPYVLHHGTWPHGSDWLCEAVAECYIPLLNVFHELADEGISPNVTLDISPVLCEQLEHKDFARVFDDYCATKIRLAAEDERYFRRHGADPHQIYLARYWQEWYAKRRLEFSGTYGNSIVKSLRHLQDNGLIEIITCAATHGYLPLLGDDRSIRLQLKTATENYKKYFGRQPHGTWIPECAYRPSYPWRTYLPVEYYGSLRQRIGVEEALCDAGLEFFVVDQPSITNSKTIGFLEYSNSGSLTMKPFFGQTEKSPMRLYNVQSEQNPKLKPSVAFARHQKIAMQVWSGDSGYPGDPVYLDFHKKHYSSALRYWRVTDNKADMMYKLLYAPDWIEERVNLHAFHFIKSIENALTSYRAVTGKLGMICTPFDAELFGHWWFEGPRFIKAVLRGLHSSPFVNAVTASQHLLAARPAEVVAMTESTWGRGNHHDVWMSDDTKWTWQAIYTDELRFRKLLEQYPPATMKSAMRRIITQALRELLLTQSSDWQFLISTFSAKDYAEQRLVSHHSDFNLLCNMAIRYTSENTLTKDDALALEEIEQRNAIFPELRIEWWAENHHSQQIKTITSIKNEVMKKNDDVKPTTRKHSEKAKKDGNNDTHKKSDVLTEKTKKKIGRVKKTDDTKLSNAGKSKR
ncbi:1,4-alpha-glucan branching protein [Ignavibacteria bacterium]|nr:DUF1957 domain-containing protein [Bacteroidota bacterium]MCZ2132462.1 DUF1957 domain-containing protein [Bacteroidota bacterium]